MLSVILTVKKLLEHPMKKSCRRQAKSKEKAIDYMSNGMAMITHSIARLIRET